MMFLRRSPTQRKTPTMQNQDDQLGSRRFRLTPRALSPIFS
jgi:hypothetical protein